MGTAANLADEDLASIDVFGVLNDFCDVLNAFNFQNKI